MTFSSWYKRINNFALKHQRIMIAALVFNANNIAWSQRNEAAVTRPCVPKDSSDTHCSKIQKPLRPIRKSPPPPRRKSLGPAPKAPKAPKTPKGDNDELPDRKEDQF